MTSTPRFDFERLKAALSVAARRAFVEIQTAHRDERIYSFALFTSSELRHILPTAATEEGLSEAARTYSESGQARGLSLDELRHLLRWRMVDSPLHLEGAGHLEEVQELLEPLPDILDGLPENSWDEFDAIVERYMGVCVDVLKQLDAEGVFGQQQRRNAIVLNVVMGSESDEERIKYARLLNPSPTVLSYQAELGLERESRYWSTGVD